MKLSAFNAIKIVAVCIIASFAISCARENSEDVNQDRIYAEYELFYDRNQDKTYASAIFRFGNSTGTQLELTSPSQVTFNNDVIPFDQGLAYYRKEYAGLVTSGTFVFTDTEGNTFTNSVSSNRDIAFPSSLDTIHNTAAYTLVWVGDSVVANERVDLWMDGPQQNNAEFFSQWTLNSNSFVLGMAQLQNLGTGSTTCTMERIWEDNAAGVTSAGGKVRCKYKAQNATIQVLP